MVEITIYEAVKDFISSLGFPIAVATFLLIRTDPVLREIRDCLKTMCIDKHRVDEASMSQK
jgi:hypothetical protein